VLLLPHILIYWKKLYFVACSGPMILIFNKGKLISFYYNFRLSFVHTIFIFRGLDSFVSYIWICTFLILLDCYLFLRL
jgi:hypothetical protein